MVPPGSAVSCGVAARDAGRPAAPARSAPSRRWLLLALAGILAAANLAGAPYFLLPIAERVRHPLHIWFKPSGYVGQSAGVMTLLLFLFMYLYPLRKRLRSLASRGSLANWLNVHIAAGLAIPIVGALHAGWRFQGVIGIGYGAMLMVSLSGIAGRYLYTHIPRGKSGIELTAAELTQRQMDLCLGISERSGLDPSEVHTALTQPLTPLRRGGLLGTCANLISGDFRRWSAMRKLRNEWQARFSLDRGTLDQIVRLARRRFALQQQQEMLQSTQRMFRYWHIVHRPFSVTAFVAVFIHVVAVVALGVTWFW